jgi:DNA-binding GntR family transcriptional regulator
MLIETHCARRVAVDGRALSGAMRDSFVAQKRALVSGGDGFVVADREFHRLIVAADGNEILTRQYDALRDRQQQMLATALTRDRGGSAS